MVDACEKFPLGFGYVKRLGRVCQHLDQQLVHSCQRPVSNTLAVLGRFFPEIA